MRIIEYKHLCFFAGVLQDEMCLQNEFYASLTDIVENGLLHQDSVFFANLKTWAVKTGKGTRITAKRLNIYSCIENVHIYLHST